MISPDLLYWNTSRAISVAPKLFKSIYAPRTTFIDACSSLPILLVTLRRSDESDMSVEGDTRPNTRLMISLRSIAS